ncbi:hypothetical protein [Aliikangiella sp. G2MR2-5]|uniref:hypothetical protein n=1 Tax=Aliikangiella sp. G2MR2-5 TaxID=2788943 RepID=UPI0018A9BC9E|nr:hypothetical protein [Aliikangiella sp. G2MR2-5]
MANGNNRSFIQNPLSFIRSHQFMVNRTISAARPLRRGSVDVDLISFDPANPQHIRLEEFSIQRSARGRYALNAFFLPEIMDDTSLIKINVNRQYFFTTELKGDLFAAYGKDPLNLTIEHVNCHSPAARVPIIPRAQAILAAGHPFCKILSPLPVPKSNRHQVKTYINSTLVVGIRSGTGWEFHYKPGANSLFRL